MPGKTSATAEETRAIADRVDRLERAVVELARVGGLGANLCPHAAQIAAEAKRRDAHQAVVA